jgi:hypothetical protein
VAVISSPLDWRRRVAGGGGRIAGAVRQPT